MWTSLDILLAALMADSGAEIHSSVLAWMKLWNLSVFQLLLIYLESTLHSVNLPPAAEGAVLQLIFIPTSSFLFPPFFHIIAVCWSNKMPRPVVFLFSMLLGAYRGKVGIGNRSEQKQVGWLPFLYLHGAVACWVGGSLPAVPTGTLPGLCRLPVLLRLGSTQRSLLTANQPRHFLSKLAGGLRLDKNKPSRKASLGCIKAVGVR